MQFKLLAGVTAALAVAVLAALEYRAASPAHSGGVDAAAPASATGKTVRLAIVNTPVHSGLIEALADDFRKESGIKIEIYGGSDVYERARAGQADIVISHIGKSGVEEFVMEGFGTWPKTVFSNQAVIAGPKSDPAGIRGLTSAADAMKKIAGAKAPFVANALPGVIYLTDMIWEQAGRPDKTGWYLDEGIGKGKAIKRAEEKQAYVIWGAIPFLRFKEKHASDFDILVSADPLLQRVMGITLVKPEKTAGVNFAGAEAFQQYLLSPKTQARIAGHRTPGFDGQLWWPSARHNAAEGHDE